MNNQYENIGGHIVDIVYSTHQNDKGKTIRISTLEVGDKMYTNLTCPTALFQHLRSGSELDIWKNRVGNSIRAVGRPDGKLILSKETWSCIYPVKIAYFVHFFAIFLWGIGILTLIYALATKKKDEKIAEREVISKYKELIYV